MSVARLGDILNAPVETDLGSKQNPPPLRGHVRFETIDFRYRVGGPPILRDLTLEIGAGEVVGIVGRSGSSIGRHVAGADRSGIDRSRRDHNTLHD